MTNCKKKYLSLQMTRFHARKDFSPIKAMNKTTFCTFHAMTAAVGRSALGSKYTAASKLAERDDDSASRNLWLRLQPQPELLSGKIIKKTSSWLFWLTELFCEAIRSKEPASAGQCAMCNANKLRLLWSQEQLEKCCQHNTCKLLWSTHLMLRPKSRFNSQFSGIITTRMELN